MASLLPGARRGLRLSESDNFRRWGLLGAEEYGILETGHGAWGIPVALVESICSFLRSFVSRFRRLAE